MLGHAIFHTARASGPSTMDRSYFGFAGADAGGLIEAPGAATSVKPG